MVTVSILVYDTVLGSPLILGCSTEEGHTSNNSYHTPPLTSSLLPTSSSPIIKSNKENIKMIMSGLVEIIKGSSDYDVPVLVPAPMIKYGVFSQLFAVCGKCVIYRSSPPKSTFYPYSHYCTIGAHSSTHQPRTSCSHLQLGNKTGSLVG